MHTNLVAPADYSTVMVGTNNQLRYVGGMRRETTMSFSIVIASDDEMEPEESFFISYEPFRNALVIPPVTEVKICGGECKVILYSAT